MKIKFTLLALIYSGVLFSQSWDMFGNNNTSVNNFVGTTNEQSLIIKSNNIEGIRVLPNGNVRFGAYNDSNYNNGSLFRIYKDSNPSIEIANNLGKFEISKNSCNGCFASGSRQGDVVLRNLGVSGNMIFYIPNNANDGNNYIGVGDDANQIWAKFLNNKSFKIDGKVLIGSSSISACSDCSSYRLFVKDGIKTEKIKVEFANANAWADYVFDDDYPLMTLGEVKSFIEKNKHLPQIPSAEDVVKNGVELKEMNVLLLKKVEELTLHMIKANEEITELKKKVTELKVNRKK